jgi:hypothetical protein
MQIQRPVFVGLDSESGQWDADVARRASAPYVVLEKTRPASTVAAAVGRT